MQYAIGYPKRRHKNVETIPKNIERKKTNEYFPVYTKLSSVNEPSGLVKANTDAKTNGTTAKITIQAIYGMSVSFVFKCLPSLI